MVRTLVGDEPAIPPGRRPAIHFTPRHGWINDPYGIRQTGDRYVMYYQSLPHRSHWSPELSWGSAISPDLVHWEEQDPVLDPQPFELGCWSGCVVMDESGLSRAFYTRVHAEERDLGQIAIARQPAPDQAFRSAPEDAVIVAPPSNLDVTAFRDPFVWFDEDHWSMIVGAGIGDGCGAVLHYTSQDLVTWTYIGVLCHGRIDLGTPDMSEVWECPQIVRVADRWVLIVSVMKNHQADHVAAAVGAFDGTTFRHDGWRRMVHGNSAYATTAFRDADGRPCTMSWLREDDPPHSARQWMGAHSVVSRLDVNRRGELVVSPHPALAAAVPVMPVLADADGIVHMITDEPHYPIRIRLPAGDRGVDLRSRSGSVRLRVRCSSVRGQLHISRPGESVDVVALDGSDETEIFIDEGIVEIFAPGAYGAWRFTPSAT